MKRLRIYLLFSQITIYIALSVCSFIKPSVAISNGGVSNFGNYPSTVALYSLGFSLCVLFLWLAADRLLQLRPRFRYLAYVLLLIGLLYLMVLVSTFPRHYSFAYSRAHDYLGIALYSVEYLLSVWLILQKINIKILFIFIIESLGMLTSLLTILKVFHFLYVGQVISALAFGVLLIYAFPDVALSKMTKQDITNVSGLAKNK